jgi:hypothetical protein
MSTNGDCIFATATDDPVTSINTLVTAYYGLAGSLDTSQSTEANAQVTVNNTFKFSELTCNVTSNSITGNSTVNLRKNAGNAGPTLSIGANATGIFNDSDTYTAAATDAMNYQIVTGSTGTSISISFIEIYGTMTYSYSLLMKFTCDLISAFSSQICRNNLFFDCRVNWCEHYISFGHLSYKLSGDDIVTLNKP